MPSDAKKKREAKKKEALKSRNQPKKAVKNETNGDTQEIIENGDAAELNGINGNDISGE